MINNIIEIIVKVIDNKYIKILLALILSTGITILLLTEPWILIGLLFVFLLTAIIYYEFFGGG